MFVVTFDRGIVVNINLVNNINCGSEKIIAETQADSFLLGKYATKERTEKVFSELITKMAENCKIHYMPEE